MDKSLLISGIIVLFLLAPLTLYVRKMFKDYQDGINENGVKVKGVVREPATSNKGPVIRYVDPNNKEYTEQYRFNSSSMRNKYKKLDEIEIMIDAKKPKNFWIVSDKTPKLIVTIMTIASVLTSVLGIVLIVYGLM